METRFALYINGAAFAKSFAGRFRVPLSTVAALREGEKTGKNEKTEEVKRLYRRARSSRATTAAGATTVKRFGTVSISTGKTPPGSPSIW